jgi:uncharacterized protein YihD (DUF1040 family)
MRELKRIEPILALIQQIWKEDPELRLCQLLLNAIRPHDACSELYALEDSTLYRKLEHYHNQMQHVNQKHTKEEE